MEAGCSEIGEEGELAVYNPRGGQRKLYKFDKVFGSDSSQEEVYEDTKALIRSVLDGNSAFLLTELCRSTFNTNHQGLDVPGETQALAPRSLVSKLHEEYHLYQWHKMQTCWV